MRLGIGKWALVGLVCVALLVAGGMIFGPGLVVRFHVSRMVAAWQSAQEVGPSNNAQSQYLKTFVRHRESLVSLGYFERMEFPIQHIGLGRNEWKKLYDDLNEAVGSVENGYFEISGYEPETKPRVVVWARPGQRQRYEKIISSLDAASANGTGNEN